jgi:Domain of unknown function (DUF6471)
MREDAMRTEAEWEDHLKGIIKAELKRKHVTYDDLSEKLKALGVDETPAAIANKISRGRFTAVFLAQCLEAIGLHTLRMRED